MWGSLVANNWGGGGGTELSPPTDEDQKQTGRDDRESFSFDQSGKKYALDNQNLIRYFVTCC